MISRVMYLARCTAHSFVLLDQDGADEASDRRFIGKVPTTSVRWASTEYSSITLAAISRGRLPSATRPHGRPCHR